MVVDVKQDTYCDICTFIFPKIYCDFTIRFIFYKVHLNSLMVFVERQLNCRHMVDRLRQSVFRALAFALC